MYRGSWSQFDGTALTIYICSLTFYYMQVTRLPSKFASRRAQDLELHRQVSLNEAKKFVIRYISHEIRTPIMIAECNMAMILEDLSESRSEDFSIRLQEGITACRTALNIVGDMLTSETMEAGKYVLHREFCPLVSLTKSIVKRLEVLGLEKNINFVMRSELPANEKVYYAYFDVPKIEQVFRNLISNSLKVVTKICIYQALL